MPLSSPNSLFSFFFSGYKQHAKKNIFCVWSFLCTNIFYNFLRNHFNPIQKMLEATVNYLVFSNWMALLCDSNNRQFYQIAELFHLLNSAYFINLGHAVDYLLVFSGCLSLTDHSKTSNRKQQIKLTPLFTKWAIKWIH